MRPAGVGERLDRLIAWLPRAFVAILIVVVAAAWTDPAGIVRRLSETPGSSCLKLHVPTLLSFTRTSTSCAGWRSET